MREALIARDERQTPGENRVAVSKGGETIAAGLLSYRRAPLERKLFKFD